MVVDERPLILARLVGPLREAGYDAVGATTFESAWLRLCDRPPHLLIAASRLGVFHGLHLICRARIDNPEMTAIVTAQTKDPVLEAEALNFGASCVVAPQTSAELLALVSQTFASRPM
jgi:DNA-binding response OmpR family regulator